MKGKRLSVLLLVGLMIFSAVGCDGAQGAQRQASATPTVTPTATTTPAATATPPAATPLPLPSAEAVETAADTYLELTDEQIEQILKRIENVPVTEKMKLDKIIIMGAMLPYLSILQGIAVFLEGSHSTQVWDEKTQYFLDECAKASAVLDQLDVDHSLGDMKTILITWSGQLRYALQLLNQSDHGTNTQNIQEVQALIRESLRYFDALDTYSAIISQNLRKQR